MVRVLSGKVHTLTNMKSTQTAALTADELAAVLGAAREGRHGVRDHAMLLTLYHHGLRVSELCRLTLPDLNLEARTLFGVWTLPLSTLTIRELLFRVHEQEIQERR